MKDKDIIKAIAELAGIVVDGEHYCEYKGHIWTCDSAGLPDEIWNPLNSHDAILPVVLKQELETQVKVVSFFISDTQDNIGDMLSLLEATPRQLAEALLRATGKWAET